MFVLYPACSAGCLTNSWMKLDIHALLLVWLQDLVWTCVCCEQSKNCLWHEEQTCCDPFHSDNRCLMVFVIVLLFVMSVFGTEPPPFFDDSLMLLCSMVYLGPWPAGRCIGAALFPYERTVPGILPPKDARFVIVPIMLKGAVFYPWCFLWTLVTPEWDDDESLEHGILLWLANLRAQHAAVSSSVVFWNDRHWLRKLFDPSLGPKSPENPGLVPVIFVSKYVLFRL